MTREQLAIIEIEKCPECGARIIQVTCKPEGDVVLTSCGAEWIKKPKDTAFSLVVRCSGS